jgi:long-chain acyl-CoA synthetase
MSPPEATLAGLVRHQGSARADHPYLHFEGATYTYADLDARSSQIAAALTADGVGVGDSVALLDKNTPLCLEVMFGAAKCGAVYVPVNWRLSPAEVAAVLADAEPAVFVVGAEFAPALGPAADSLTGARLLVAGTAQVPFHAFEEWAGRHEPIDPGVETSPDDAALQHYTSGTTGDPKGVTLTNANLLGRLGESAAPGRCCSGR